MFDFKTARMHMVESQVRPSDVTDLNLIKAFRQIPRELFVPKSKQALAYTDRHILLDDGYVMARPRDLAKLIQALEVKPDDAVLDIACSRGYSTAILAQLAETVVGLEVSESAVEKASRCLGEAGIDNAAVVEGDLKSGIAQHGPFNVIIVQGAVCDVPKAWFEQLTDGGRLAVVTQDGSVGRARVYTRSDTPSSGKTTSGYHIGERIIFDTSLPILPGFAKVPAFQF